MVYSRSGLSDGLKTVVGFQSCHRWYVSGTPFPHGLDSLLAALQFLDFNVVSEPRIMMPDGSVYVSKDCDVLAPAASRKSAPSKGKSRATPVHSRLMQLKPKTYMSFLMRFIHKQLFIRNTKETIVEERHW